MAAFLLVSITLWLVLVAGILFAGGAPAWAQLCLVTASGTAGAAVVLLVDPRR